MKKSEINKLDRLWSEKVKEKAGYICEYGLNGEECRGRLESAHIVGRASVTGGRSTRWGAWIGDKYDLNGMSLCIHHHQHYDNHGPLHEKIFNNLVGVERKEKLNEVVRVIAKNQDPEQIRQWIKEA